MMLKLKLQYFGQSCEELTYWKRLWYGKGLGAGGKGDDGGWDGWMASPTLWTWVWVNSRSWWWTGRPGVLWFMVMQTVGHDWATELNWEYIMRNAGLDEAQAGIKIARRNINNLRYAEDTTVMAESEELKSLLMKVKEESEKVGLKQHSENEDHGIWSHHSMANRWGNSDRLYFLGPQNHCRWWLQSWN